MKVNKPHLAELIYQFYFAGYTVPEMAKFGETYEKDVDRNLREARTYLRVLMKREIEER